MGKQARARLGYRLEPDGNLAAQLPWNLLGSLHRPRTRHCADAEGQSLGLSHPQPGHHFDLPGAVPKLCDLRPTPGHCLRFRDYGNALPRPMGQVQPT